MVIDVYADGADLKTIRAYAGDSRVAGYTTNPSLLRKAGIADYKSFAHAVLECCGGKPVSFEVLSDDLSEMANQALEIGSWGHNVFVKVPITNTEGKSTGPVCEYLSSKGVKLNITAVMTLAQVRMITDYAAAGSIISVFAGRVADTGRDPRSIMRFSAGIAHQYGMRLLWASAREVLNVVHAEDVGCDIITLTPEFIEKMGLFGMDLELYSLATVKQFQQDAEGITL